VRSVSRYAIGPGGALTPLSPATVSTGIQPFSVTVDPSGRFAYVSNVNGSTVSQYTIGPGGALTALSPATVPAGSGPVSIVTVRP
jgi:DNA-binding beta-propeller fold protein YncE